MALTYKAYTDLLAAELQLSTTPRHQAAPSSATALRGTVPAFRSASPPTCFEDRTLGQPHSRLDSLRNRLRATANIHPVIIAERTVGGAA